MKMNKAEAQVFARALKALDQVIKDQDGTPIATLLKDDVLWRLSAIRDGKFQRSVATSGARAAFERWSDTPPTPKR